MSDLLAEATPTAPADVTPPTTPPQETPILDAAPPALEATPPSTAKFNNELPPDWFLALGDKFAPEAPTLGKFKTVEDLAKSFLHFRKTGAAYPAEDASPQDIERFRALANVPETPDGYGLQKPKTLPDGIPWSDEAAKQIAETAHKYHVPAPALQAIADAYIAQEVAAAEAQILAQKAEREAAIKDLRQTFGADFERNAAEVRHVASLLAEKVGITPDDAAFKAALNNPAAIKMLHQVAKMMGEDGLKRPAGYGDLRSDAQRANDIMQGKDSEWSERYRRGEREAVDMVATLLKRAGQ